MVTFVKIDNTLKGRLHQAIQRHVECKEARESFKQEALVSWTSYKETGRHLTGEQTRTWLNTWGAGDEPPIPECHA